MPILDNSLSARLSGPTRWTLAHGRSLELGPHGLVMGILNVTPDSFSDGGRFGGVGEAVAAALQMVEDGAAIIDIGGESTRPGAEPICAETEQARVLPVIEALAARSDVIISVDTYRAETARGAVKRGAHILNDVWGLQRDAAMAEVAAATGAGLCIMHTGRDRMKLSDAVEDQMAFLGRSLEIARQAGVRDEQIVLDPGFGFAKDTGDNLRLMTRLDELHRLGRPILVGTSRKRFIGALTGREAPDRDAGTVATTIVLRLAGAAIFRVHDVPQNRDALVIAEALIADRAKAEEERR